MRDDEEQSDISTLNEYIKCSIIAKQIFYSFVHRLGLFRWIKMKATKQQPVTRVSQPVEAASKRNLPSLSLSLSKSALAIFYRASSCGMIVGLVSRECDASVIR